MKFFNHAFAMLLGSVYFPLKSLGRSIRNGAIIWGIGIGLGFIIPIASASAMSNAGVSVLKNIAITTFITFPISTTVIAALLTLATGFIIYKTVTNFFLSIWMGLKAGYQDGMDGFYRVNHETNPPVFSDLSVQMFINRQQTMNEPDFYGLQNIYTDLQDVVVERPDLDTPDLGGETNDFSQFLTDEEINEIQSKLNQLSQADRLTTPEKLKKDLLVSQFRQYTDLHDKLQKVKKALDADKMDEIEDDLMQMEVTTPIFFTKQYQDNHEWKSVPGAGYVTDKECLLDWFKRSDSHPFSRDSIKNPSPYSGFPARYQWFELTKERWYVPELVDITKSMRDLLSDFNVSTMTPVSQMSMLNGVSDEPSSQNPQEFPKHKSRL